MILTTMNCTNCKKEFTSFLTKRNMPSKRCITCSEKETIREATRAPRNRNYKEERAKHPETHYVEYQRGASKRSLEFTLSFPVFQELVQDKCYYCHHKVDGEANGIDRVDNGKGYTSDNCVTCCEMCNIMKGPYNQHYFLQKCSYISSQTFPSDAFFVTWKYYYTRTQTVKNTQYKKEAIEKRKLNFELTETEFAHLTRSACYLCGFKRSSGLGIDRVDNSIRSYTLANCRPCCGPCNAMKNNYSLEQLREICGKITTIHTPDLTVTFATNQAMPERAQVKWTATSLYYQLIANMYNEFKEFNQNVLNDDEIQAYITLVNTNTKSDSLAKIKVWLLDLNQRRTRARKIHPQPLRVSVESTLSSSGIRDKVDEATLALSSSPVTA